MMKELQREVWESTYRYKGETIEGTWRRVAKCLAKHEEDSVYWEEKFYNNLEDFKCSLGGRILSNAGTEYTGTSLLNCFVLGGRLNSSDYRSNYSGDNADSIEGIYTDLLEQALTLKSEGGWGTNFSHLRPRGSYIKGIGAESPGAVKFMELFDKSSEIVTAGSGLKKKYNQTKTKIRKGAMMGVLEIWHPDVIEFITAKQSQNRLSKFNISVGVTNKFMEAVREDEDWNLIFPDTTFKCYKKEWDGNINLWIEKGYPVEVFETKKARQIWDLIMKSTYTRNEPGIIFIDIARNLNNLKYCEYIKSSNPCSEIFLPDGGVCLLGSINLVHFTINGEWDYEALAKAIETQIRMMDNVNDETYVALDIQKRNLQEKRRIGLGIMGYASALIMMKKRYGSDEALKITDELMSFIVNKSYQTSSKIAKEKGSFELFDEEKYLQSEFVKNILSDETINMIKENGIRNSHLMAIAPNGNTSIFYGIVSGGLEPVFSLEYDRWVIVNEVPDELDCPKYHEGIYEETSHFKWGKMGDEDVLVGINGWSDYMIDKNRGLVKKNTVRDYAYDHMKQHSEEYDLDADYVVTTTKLSPEDHINTMQVMAKYVDQAISKTINLPNDYKYEDFKDIYMKCWEGGYIKGFTTYRAGTMTAVLTAKEEKEKETINGEEIIHNSIKLPDNYDSKGIILRAEGKKWYIHVPFFPESNRPFAIFVSTNSYESSVVVNDAIEILDDLARSKGVPDKWVDQTLNKCKSQSGAIRIARMISLCLRHGIFIKHIISALDQVEDSNVTTFVFAIKKYLASYIRDGENANGKCPSCEQDSLIFQEGCKVCRNCGYSACG